MSRPIDDHASGYEIRIKGHLDRRWTARFDGLSMRYEADGTTVMSGPVNDQTALHGVLERIRDLGLPLISVTPSDPDEAEPAGRSVRRLPPRGL